MSGAALACPRCEELLARAELGLTCSRCAKSYPVLGGIPCLVPEPDLFRIFAASGLEEYLSASERRLAEVREESRAPGLLPRTRERLLGIARALETGRARIEALFAPLKPAGPALPVSAIPTRPIPSDDLPLLKCYEHLFRDWAWGAAESELSRSLVARVVSAPLGDLAVYGAGAGRLAVDVHQTLGPDRTFALDLNPLPLLVAHEVVNGRTLELFEFPIGPERQDDVVIEQHLACPYPVREGFELLFADALRAPFATGTLDSILTPWFIDAVDSDLPATLAAINRALRLGGSWIHLGPLRFTGSAGRQYVIEEVLEIARLSGFEPLQEVRQKVPYFDSPFSGSRRIETVFCFAARKVAEAERAPLPSSEPPWIADPKLPVPLTPELASLRRTAVFTTGVIGMIDGMRSISEIAAQLAKTWRVEASGVEQRLRTFFARVPKR